MSTESNISASMPMPEQEMLLQSARNEMDSGKYEEARTTLKKGIRPGTLAICLAALHREMARTYICQKLWNEAPAHIGEAEVLMEYCKTESNEWINNKIEVLLVKGLMLYFTMQPEQAVENNKLLKKLIEHHGTSFQRLHYYQLVVYCSYQRYQFYDLPEETLTHCYFAVDLARQLNDRKMIISALSEVAFTHLLRHELKESIAIHQQCLALITEEDTDIKVIAYNYIAVSYRMMNRVQECEEWSIKTRELSETINNNTYKAISEANLSWINLMRGNDLYAIQYAENSFEIMEKLRHPFLWLAVMPLLSIYTKEKNWSNAGIYAHSLFLPLRKRLPQNVDIPLKKMVTYWMEGDFKKMEPLAKEVLIEVLLSGYL